MFGSLSVQRRKRLAGRLAAVALTSGLIAGGSIAGAASATADEGPQQGGASATLNGLTTFDQAVLVEDGERKQLPAGLFEMAVEGGGTLKTYCIDIHNPTQQKARYQETPWEQTSLGQNDDAGRIRWILQNSYPQVDDLEGLARKADAGALTRETAAAGTQVAIWRYSDDVEVEAVDPAAEKLADWLEENAKDLEEPKASLSLDPAAVSGPAGTRIGPVTVRTNAEQASVNLPSEVAATGVKVTDKAGKPLTEAADGTELYVDVPADAKDGSATFAVQAATSVSVGRAFASLSRSQTQILAGSSESTVSAAATASWGAVPALSAKKNCAKGGVDITAANNSDKPFTFELMGLTFSIGAGESKTVTVPVAEDQPYDFTIALPGGKKKTFKGVLDCKTTSSSTPATGGSTDGTTGGDHPGDGPAPQSGGTSTGTGTGTVGATATGGSTTGTTGGGATTGAPTTPTGDLAETGSSGATPMIAGIAAVFLLVGGGAVFFLRKKKDA